MTEFPEDHPAKHQGDKAVKRLDIIILPRIDLEHLEQEYLEDAATRLAELAGQNDPSGKGVPINILIPCKMEKIDPDEKLSTQEQEFVRVCTLAELDRYIHCLEWRGSFARGSGKS